MRSSPPVKVKSHTSQLHILMDQSTQVNFPTVMQNPKKQTMKRHNTSGEIILQNKGTQLTANTWVNWKQQSLPRPKSLNFQSDGFKMKLYNDSQISQLSLPIPESNVSSLSKERSPAYSCNSSIISMSKNGYKPYVPPKLRYGHQDEESNGGSCKCYCKCYEIDKEHPKIPPSNTKQGLSWRRLHMSRAKLKATSTTSELLSGFAMVAMVELQINEETGVPEWLFVMFAVCTTVLVSVHIFALMISTYILPNIDAIAKLEICEMVAESPHERMRGFIELAWAFSTVLGLFLFLVEIAILCWVKFWDYSFPAAIAATVIVIPVLVIFVIFTVHFYHSLVVYKCNTSLDDMEKLESMKKQLDEISSPV